MPCNPGLNSALTQILAVGAGGMIGASLRFLAKSMTTVGSDAFYHTLTVNLTGSFIIGIVWVMLNRFNAPALLSLFLITGILGGYTTCSAFSLDCLQLAQSQRWGRLAFYWTATVAGSPLACAAGYWISSRLLDYNN